jgi:hypothetical protein
VTEKAAVLCPEPEHAVAGIEHCEACGYTLYGLVRDWQAAIDLLRAEIVQVIVVARHDTWAPRIEFAERRNQRIVGTAGTSNTRWRRARVVRRYN